MNAAEAQQFRVTDELDRNVVESGGYMLDAVLSWFRVGEGSEPGHFYSALLHALTHADSTNGPRLAMAFPEIAVPFTLARDVPGGTEAIRAARDLQRDTGVVLSRYALLALAERFA